MALVLLALADLIGLIIYGRLFLGHFAGGTFNVPYDYLCFREAGTLLGTQGGAHAAGITGVCDYMYPPPFLLLERPLPMLPPVWGLIAWTLCGVTLLALAARRAKLPHVAVALALVSPGAVYNFTIGQNGFVTSALLLVALADAPVLAGLAAGALVMKPHLAILLPVVFAAARNKQAFLMAALTALAMVVVSWLLFGPGVWGYYLHQETALASHLLQRPWPESTQAVMVSPFIAARSLGAGREAAWAVQGTVIVTAALLVWRMWRPGSGAAPLPRLVTTLALVYLTTPFDYIYDTTALAAALAAYGLTRPRHGLYPLALLCLVLAVYMPLDIVTFSTGAVALALCAAYGASELRSRPANTTT